MFRALAAALAGSTVATARRPRPTTALLFPTLSFVLGTSVHTTFVFFLVPAYAQAIGLGRLQLVAFVASALATMAVGVPAGRLTDRVPRRRVMRLGWAMEGASMAWLAFAPAGVVTLLLAAAGAGAGLAFSFTAFQSYVADIIHKRALPSAFGITGSLALLGSAAGPLVGAAILGIAGAGEEGTRLVSGALAAAGLAAALTTFMLPSMRTADSPRGVGPRVGFAIATLHAFDPRPSSFETDGPPPARQERRSLRAYAVAYALLGFGYGMTVPWFGPRMLNHFGMSASAWGAVLAWSAVLAAGAIYLAGIHGRRGGQALPTALWANLVVGAALVGFAFAPGMLLAAAFFLVRQVFGTPTGSVLGAGLAAEVSAHTRGQSFGMMNVAWNLPWAAGAAAGGALLVLVEGWMFVVGAAFLVAGPIAALALRSGGVRPPALARRAPQPQR